MKLVRASEADFVFPMVGWFADGSRHFSERDDLLACPSTFYEDEALIGVELVDSSLRRWVVRSVELKSPLPKKRWWHRRLLFFILLPITFWLALAFDNSSIEIDPQLEQLAPLDLDEVKTRMLQGHEENWDMSDPDEVREYRAEVAKVRKARSLAKLIELLAVGQPAGFID